VRRNKKRSSSLIFSYKSRDKKEILNYMLFIFSSPLPSRQLLLHCSTYPHPCGYPAGEDLRANKIHT